MWGLVLTWKDTRNVLGMWGSPGGEGAKYWLCVPTEIKNRGVKDIFFLVCDGLKGLPDAVEATWPEATVQTCVLHLMRNMYQYASRKDWDGLEMRYQAHIFGAFPDCCFEGA